MTGPLTQEGMSDTLVLFDDPERPILVPDVRVGDTHFLLRLFIRRSSISIFWYYKK